MKIELIRNARPAVEWLSTERMVHDLMANTVVLQPGDKLFVHDTPRGARPTLRLVDAEVA